MKITNLKKRPDPDEGLRKVSDVFTFPEWNFVEQARWYW